MTAAKKQYTIQAAVKELVLKDSEIMRLLKTPYFNTSAYARQIQGRVERMVGHRVKLNTITVSLKRLAKRLDNNMITTGTADALKVEDLVVKAPLTLIKISNTPAGRVVLSRLVADKRFDEVVNLISLSGATQDIYLAVGKNFKGDLAKFNEVGGVINGEFALITIVSNGNITDVLEYIGKKFRSESVKPFMVEVIDREVRFVVDYPELIKVLTWFS